MRRSWPSRCQSREMRMKRKKHFGIALALFFSLAQIPSLAVVVQSRGKKPLNPSPSDKCPVCGMFVAKYPDFLAEILFNDGTYAVFDGTKDMFRFYFNMKKYRPSKEPSDIDAIFVKDYYSLDFIDGYEAYYVLGSDIYGPMGKELIPLENPDDAKTFLEDHKGQAILKFSDITSDLIRGLD